MRLRGFSILAAALAAAALARGAEQPTYTLGVPEEPGEVRYPSTAPIDEPTVTNAWMNGVFVPTGGFSTEPAVTDPTGDTTDSTRYTLVQVDLAFSWERSKPEYYLADRVKAPDDVDWDATTRAYEQRIAEGGVTGFLLNPDPSNPGVYAVDGGTQSFTWYLKNGTSNVVHYTIGSTCSARPLRIFWTDAPYNAPMVSLEGKFARLFGNASVITPVLGATTNFAGGVYTVQSNIVTKGVYIDPTAHVLQAVGGVEGQFVIVYYDTGDYRNILHMAVVEATRPEAVVCKGEIGKALKPTGRGYGIEGLTATVTAGISDADDNRGDYLYQHSGLYSYSPKDGDVYPLRPTIGKRWKAEVYWMETDPMGVQWPFEMDHYENDWPADGVVFVRGDLEGEAGAKIYIPDDYTATLEKFQEPEGHARAIGGDNVFNTTGAGWSLVRLTTDDNVWFMPVHSVLRSDRTYFTLASARIAVGEEFLIRGGSRAGISSLCTQELPVTDAVSGYIYKPASGTQYNPDLYYETTNATGSTQLSVGSSTKVPSAVFAVNVQTRGIEVWWSRRFQEDDMPAWIDVPTLPQAYQPVWPAALEAPTIVIASQQGSANRCAWQQRGAAHFDTRSSTMRLASRQYFPDGNGTLSFWTRPLLYEDEVVSVTNPPSAILELGSSTGSAFVIRVGADEMLEFVFDNAVVMSTKAEAAMSRLNAWMYVTVSFEKNGKVRFYKNGIPVGEITNAALVSALSGYLDRNYAGVSEYAQTGASAPSQAVADPLDCGTFEEMRAAFASGRNVRLTNDIAQASAEAIVIASGTSVAIDLNGYAVTGSSGTAQRMFSVRGALALCDASGGGAFVGGGTVTALDGAFACVLDGGTLTLNGGTVQGFASAGCGGAIAVTDGGTLTQAGGAIVSNAVAQAGGGVYVDGGTFVMTGGRLVGNTSASRHPCLALREGTVLLNGGAFDVEPTVAAVRMTECESTFDAPACFPSEGLWYVGTPTAPGRQISELMMNRTDFMKGLTYAQIADRILTRDENDQDLTGYYSFRPGEDLLAESQSASGADKRQFFERVSGSSHTAKGVSLTTPGAPYVGNCIIYPDDETVPTIYYQNDKSAVGYNPNEEHAIVMGGEDGYVAWALRSDLNTTDSIPGVLVSYVQNGQAKMQFFHVVATNADWPALAADCTVGRALPGPHPLDLLDDPWLQEDYWQRDAANPDAPGVAYRDRKGQLWARAAGTLPIYMYYRLQEGFWFPQYAADAQPAEGTAVPWLAVLADPKAAVDPVKGTPACWTWTAKWPETANEMRIGQTLTSAADGLPGVWDMKSVALVYPTPYDETGTVKTVVLTDPTVQKSVSFDSQLLATLGLTTDANGGLTLRKGRYYFTELPPHLSNRVFVDTSNDKLCLVGELNGKNAGVSVLYVNVLSANERQLLKDLVSTDNRGKAEYAVWTAAVDALAPQRTEPNTVTLYGDEVKTDYLPRDHYALSAMGSTNWVVLVENDGPTEPYEATVDGVRKTVSMGVSEGDAVNMHVFKVIGKYYEGRIVAREDEQNLLSQRLSVLYTESFAGEAENYEFEWKSASPSMDGTVPTDYDGGVYQKRVGFPDAQTPRISIGGQGDTLANMVNKYWICRYRAKDANCPAWKVMGNSWSGWCAPPALAEGWVQRVLNNVTPFNQLMTDLYENKAETTISMIAKAGRPYTGDVAFNNDSLTEHGLIEIYETLLNKAESMSLLLGVNNTDANKQLLLCAERLGDLYAVLGDEAYSDAKNPTIGFGSTMTFSGTTQTQVDFGAASSSLFCFDNQVASLLDEELALLRGRTGDSAPYVVKNGVKTLSIAPYYNRLLWNFTKGITAGEVAYAVNYNIEGTETTALSEEQAAALYPQGHGDAYGHYLSALKGWYRLLRNPYFTWPRAQGEMNVADVAVNVDYFEEAKFAQAAAKVAKTAADVVDLTARESWGDTGTTGGGYLDDTSERAFGYGEWANRGAYGALVNWAVANSLLPEDSASVCSNAVLDRVYKDMALSRIDRGTVAELDELSRQVNAIQTAEDRVDAGRNPLGFSTDAIPFDISPIGANDGTKTHFEQIRARAATAVENARVLLERAQEYSNRLRMIQEATDSYEDAISAEESDYDSELVGYYGKPYSDDIGPGATYAQGYDGPDLLHYMWMDLSKYGLTSVEDTVSVKSYYFTGYDRGVLLKLVASILPIDAIASAVGDIGSLAGANQDGSWFGNLTADAQNAYREDMLLKCEVTASGLVKKPDAITGTRPRQGSIQEKYGEFLKAYVAFLRAQDDYNDAVSRYEYESGMAAYMNALNSLIMDIKIGVAVYGTVGDEVKAYTQQAINALEEADKLTTGGQESVSRGIPATFGAGMTVITDLRSIAHAAQTAPRVAAATKFAVARVQLKNSLITTSKVGLLANHAMEFINAIYAYYESVKAEVNTVVTCAENVTTAQRAMHDAVLAMNTAVEEYRAEIAKAEGVCEKRYQARIRQVNQLTQARYNDMFFRLLRNQALARYTTAFDLAQKYVWETAKAYDYETALLSADQASGEAFLSQIVASRSLGSFQNGQPVVGDVGDTGLAGLLAQMDANWLVLKPRLGINNPQPYATWFSLRSECFRILQGAEGDRAWAKELAKYWVDDLKTHPDFIRHCQLFQSQDGLKDKEPGLIIPFETTVDFAKNFFGNDLAGEDNAYDSTWYATRIYAAGVWFDGYNARANGYAQKAFLANTPGVYLVPMGLDCMRVPGLEDGTVIGFNVVDQVIAAPYPIGSQCLNDLNWYPSASEGDLGGADATTKIRKHPSFRAYFDTNGGEPSDDKLDCTRLVGRSVWNTKWMLVIPAGLLNSDREKALSVFINGNDANRDGKIDLLPVRDIRIGFKTYSNSGN